MSVTVNRRTRLIPQASVTPMRCHWCEEPIAGDAWYRQDVIWGHELTRFTVWARENGQPSTGIVIVGAKPFHHECLALRVRAGGRLGCHASKCRGCPRIMHDVAWRRLWCSPACGDRCARASARSDRACGTCSRTFDPPRADARFCSDGCRQRAYRERIEARVV